MSEFTPINTQEDFDKAIASRIARAERNAEKAAEEKYAGYMSPESVSEKYNGWVSAEDHEKLKAEHSALTEQVSELNKTIKTHQINDMKSKIAREVGLGYGLESRLSGETEEDIRKDAEALKSLIGSTTKTTIPLASKDGKIDAKANAYAQLLGGLKK